jgi:protein subunit release factor A
MESVILEIRPGEGGDDSKLFAADMAKMYAAYAGRIGMTAS